MKRRKVFVQPSARQDLVHIRTWIKTKSSVQVADRYLKRLRAALARLSYLSDLSPVRDDLGEGVRQTNFEGRYVVLFALRDDEVHVLRIVHGARDLDAVQAGLERDELP